MMQSHQPAPEGKELTPTLSRVLLFLMTSPARLRRKPPSAPTTLRSALSFCSANLVLTAALASGRSFFRESNLALAMFVSV